jgi:hypothetical protein
MSRAARDTPNGLKVSSMTAVSFVDAVDSEAS